jgi:RNA polymerase sigma-70 factor (ECF subfamily)
MALPEPVDQDLLRRTLAGDEAAFTELYRRRQAGIYRFALHMSGSRTVAEDVTQEVFLVLLRDGAVYDPRRGSVSAFLYGVARNLVRRASQAGDVAASPQPEGDESAAQPDAGTDPIESIARVQTVESVQRAVLSLPSMYREVVVLCDLQEMDYADAARVLDCAVGTVRSRLHRARRLLEAKLRPRRRGALYGLQGV